VSRRPISRPPKNKGADISNAFRGDFTRLLRPTASDGGCHDRIS
jgi:hypothetical protein